MIAPFRILITLVLQALIATAAPVGICLHAFSPEAPAEKIECFEFEKVERAAADYRFFPSSDKSVMVTAYRFRGTILYKPELAPTHPEFDKLLKLYEETARATPSTRPYLNPKILAMRAQAAGVAKQIEDVAKSPTITMADGTQLTGCTMSKIENGFVSIRHQDGISKVSLTELDATEKKALNSTAEGWSLDDPAAMPKDSTGTFAKIVFKNGVLLKKAKFKEVADGNLVFMADGKSVSVPADQFPGELSVLGEEVVKSLAPVKKEASPEPTVASSGSDKPPTVPVQSKRANDAFGGDFALPGDEDSQPERINVPQAAKINELDARIKRRAEVLAKAKSEGKSPPDTHPNEGTNIVKGLYIGMNGEDALLQLRTIFGDDLEFIKKKELLNGHIEVIFFDSPSPLMHTNFQYEGCLIDIDTKTGRLHAFSISGDHLDKMFSSAGVGYEDFCKQFMKRFGIQKLEHQASEGKGSYNVYACVDRKVKIRLSNTIGEMYFKHFSMDQIIDAKF